MTRGESLHSVSVLLSGRGAGLLNEIARICHPSPPTPHPLASWLLLIYGISDFSPTTIAKAIQNSLGITYAFRNLSVVVSNSSASGASCIDVGTGLSPPVAYFEKAPFPQSGGAYSGSSIVVSPISTLASYVLAVGSLTTMSAAFNRTAAALGLSAVYPDLSM